MIHLRQLLSGKLYKIEKQFFKFLRGTKRLDDILQCISDVGRDFRSQWYHGQHSRGKVSCLHDYFDYLTTRLLLIYTLSNFQKAIVVADCKPKIIVQCDAMPVPRLLPWSDRQEFRGSLYVLFVQRWPMIHNRGPSPSTTGRDACIRLQSLLSTVSRAFWYRAQQLNKQSNRTK